jgi:biopolymer transport protein ExbB/TolQ
MQDDYKIFVTVVIAVGSAILSWFVSDVRSKSRLAYVEEKFNAFYNTMSANYEKIAEHDIKFAKSEQDRAEIHRSMERIDNQKASKEVVDGFRAEISNLRADMDRRFDRIERLLEGKMT